MDLHHAIRRSLARQLKHANDNTVMPVHDPAYNFREILKQLILLEDHLSHPRKVCPECIQKHLLTIEAMAEEATTLAPPDRWYVVGTLYPALAREWLNKFTDGTDRRTLAQDVRRMRKGLQPLVFDPRKPLIKVASRYLALGCPHR